MGLFLTSAGCQFQPADLMLSTVLFRLLRLLLRLPLLLPLPLLLRLPLHLLPLRLSWALLYPRLVAVRYCIIALGLFSLSLLWARTRLVFCRVVSLLLLTSGLRRRGGRYHNCWRWRSNSTSLLDHCVGHDILRFRYFNIAKSVGPLSSECGECVSVWVWVCMCVLGR